MSVILSKFPAGRRCEQDFEITIFAIQVGFGTLKLQEELNITSKSVITFPADEQKYQFWLTIEEDAIVEYAEELRLTYSLTGAGVARCEASSGCNSAISIQIEDNDGK